MQVAQVLAGYTLGSADLLRRAMGKKVQAEMDAQKVTFVQGAMARGVPEKQAAGIFDQVNKFAGYGFNKSHAAAYALVAYHTGWLKANYPVEFLAASMTLDLGNTDKLNVFRQELDRLGIPLLGPDVNRSQPTFSVEPVAGAAFPKGIRYALGAVKGVGIEAMKRLAAERAANGPYVDIYDFARRLDTQVINKRQLEMLVLAGAFDAMDGNRARLHAGVDTLVRYSQTSAAERDSGQNSLFGGGGQALPAPRLPEIHDWEMMEKLRHEFGAIGFYLSAHPLDSYNTGRVGAVPFAEVMRRLRGGRGTSFKMAGIVVAKRETTTKTGNRMAFVQLSDASGVYEVTVFAEVLVDLRPLMEEKKPLLLTVEAQPNNDAWRFTVTMATDLEAALAQAGVHLRVRVEKPDAVAHLAEVLADQKGKGRGRISLRVPVAPLREADIELPGAFGVTSSLRGALRGIPGVLEVQEL